MTDVLEHLPHPDRVLSEVRRILRPGGYLLIGVPFLYGLHEEPHDFHRYTEWRLRRFCCDHDFRVISLQTYGSGLSVMADLACKLLGRHGWTAWLVRGVSWLAVAVASAGRNETNTSTPAGYFLVAQVDGDPP